MALKTRLSYVSNSSSSSYIVFGRRLGCFEEMGGHPFDFDNKQYLLVGKMLTEGLDLMRLTADLCDFFRAEGTVFEDQGDVIEYELVLKEPATMLVPFKVPAGVAPGSDAFVIQADYKSTTDLASAHENYWLDYRKRRKKR